MTAVPVPQALDEPPVRVQPIPVTRPPYSAGTGTIRRAMVDCAGLAVIVAVTYATYLIGG